MKETAEAKKARIIKMKETLAKKRLLRMQASTQAQPGMLIPQLLRMIADELERRTSAGL